MAVLNEREAARVALEQVWSELAAAVAMATEHELAAKEDPSLLQRPDVLADTRWLFLFREELGDVQTVYETSRAGAKVSADSLHAAEVTGRKLLELISRARESAAAVEPAAAGA
jgi:hypothetical protein